MQGADPGTNPADGLRAQGRDGDEIDPELLSLRQRRGPVGPLLPLSVVTLSLYFLITLRADLRFSIENSQPVAITNLSDFLAHRARAGQFVRIRAHPDRAMAVRIASGEHKDGLRVAPALGTRGALWLALPGSAWHAPPAYEDVYQGRLRPMAQMPFFRQLRQHAAEIRERSVATAAVQAALASGADRLRTPAGDTFLVTGATRVRVNERVRDRARVVSLATNGAIDRAGWVRRLAAAGVLAAGDPAIEESADRLVIEVTAARGIQEVAAALARAGLLQAYVTAVERSHQTSWAELDATASALVIGPARVGWEDITSVAVRASSAVSEPAWILVTTEEPGDFWYLIALYAILAVTAAFFSWVLVRSLQATAPRSRAARTVKSTGPGTATPHSSDESSLK